MTIAIGELERLLAAAYIAAPGAGLRIEDKKKVAELAALVPLVARVLPRSRTRALRIVDAAAGKGYVGLAIAAYVVAPRAQSAEIVAIERSARRLADATAAFAGHAPMVSFVPRCGDVGDDALWPDEPDLVIALHACESASDATLTQAIARRARHVIVIPCCVANGLLAVATATAQLDALAVPPDAEIRRPMIEALVLAERVMRLRNAGYEVTVPAFVGPSVTPFNKAIVGRRGGRR